MMFAQITGLTRPVMVGALAVPLSSRVGNCAIGSGTALFFSEAFIHRPLPTTIAIGEGRTTQEDINSRNRVSYHACKEDTAAPVSTAAPEPRPARRERENEAMRITPDNPNDDVIENVSATLKV
jgi:hypothetical protein